MKKNLDFINPIESNRNDFLPMDQVEEAMNILATSRNRIKKLWDTLEITRKKTFRNHNLKQGLIYYNLGEEYLKNGLTDFAKTCLEISINLVEEESKLYNSVLSVLQRIDTIENMLKIA